MDKNTLKEKKAAVKAAEKRAVKALVFLAAVQEQLQQDQDPVAIELVKLAKDSSELLSLAIRQKKFRGKATRRSMMRFVVSATEMDCVPDEMDLKRFRKHCFTPTELAKASDVTPMQVYAVEGVK